MYCTYILCSGYVLLLIIEDILCCFLLRNEMLRAVTQFYTVAV